MKHIPPDELVALRALLESEREQLEDELAEHGHKSDDSDWTATATGFEEQEPDIIDSADRFEELATNVPIVEGAEKRLADVVHAIQKMEAGTYGICEVSGKEIPVERLRANPEARTLVEYAS